MSPTVSRTSCLTASMPPTSSNVVSASGGWTSKLPPPPPAPPIPPPSKDASGLAGAAGRGRGRRRGARPGPGPGAVRCVRCLGHLVGHVDPLAGPRVEGERSRPAPAAEHHLLEQGAEREAGERRGHRLLGL